MRIIIQVIAFVILISGMPIYGDQNNHELDVLFHKLRMTTNADEATGITKQIWTNWYQSDISGVAMLMWHGGESMRQARYDEAVKYFTKVIDIAPIFAEGWNRRATAYYLMKEYQLSTDDITKTLALEPRHFGALSGQGLIYWQLQKYGLALLYMNRALQVNPHLSAMKEYIKAIQKLIDDKII